MNHRLFTYKWVGHWCYGKCTCGWLGRPTVTLDGAEAVWKAHVRDKCPLVPHTIPDDPEFDVDGPDG